MWANAMQKYRRGNNSHREWKVKRNLSGYERTLNRLQYVTTFCAMGLQFAVEENTFC